MEINRINLVFGIIILIVVAFSIVFSINFLVSGSSVLPFSSDADQNLLENSKTGQANIFKNNVFAAFVIGFLSGAVLLAIGFFKVLNKWQHGHH